MQKQQVFYIHGGSAFESHEDYLQYLRTREVRSPHGFKSEFWPTRLREDLGEDFEVFTPSMPNRDNAKYEEWKVWFERHFEYLRDDLILIGWSQGALFLLKYLVENDFPFKIKAFMLVGSPGFYFKAENGEDGADFNFDWNMVPKLGEYIPDISIWHSQDDFVVPYEHAEHLAELLPEAELVTFTDRNHFLQPEFPELVARIKEAAR